jgi:Ca2+-transporting ATPase
MLILPCEANRGFEANWTTTKEKQLITREDYWSMPPANVFEALKTSDHGLSEQEAQRRIRTYGHNELPTQALSSLQIFFRQFKNPIFIILIACAVIAGLFAEVKQSIIILSMIALSVILGFFNEYRAEKIVVNLRRNVSIKAVVTRDGKPCEIDSRELVPGDILVLESGDLVPADARLIESVELNISMYFGCAPVAQADRAAVSEPIKPNGEQVETKPIKEKQRPKKYKSQKTNHSLFNYHLIRYHL